MPDLFALLYLRVCVCGAEKGQVMAQTLALRYTAHIVAKPVFGVFLRPLPGANLLLS